MRARGRCGGGNQGGGNMGGGGRPPCPIYQGGWNQGGGGGGMNGNPHPGQIQQNGNGVYQGGAISPNGSSTQRFNVNTNGGAFIHTGGDGWYDENGQWHQAQN
jgi:hypothetical protein